MSERFNIISQSAVYILNTGCEDSFDILTTTQLQTQSPVQNWYFPQSSGACQTTAFGFSPGNYNFAAYKGTMIQKYSWIWIIANTPARKLSLPMQVPESISRKAAAGAHNKTL